MLSGLHWRGYWGTQREGETGLLIARRDQHPAYLLRVRSP